MAKLVIDGSSPDDHQEIEVEDFTEATWNLVLDLHNTADKNWSLEVLREWLVQYMSQTTPKVVKPNSMDGTGSDTMTFRYDRS